MSAPVLPPIGPDLKVWGQNLTTYLRRNLDRIRFKRADDNISEDGILLWDEEYGYPVVSKGGEWRQIVLADGYAQFIQDADITAASADTAYAIEFDAPSMSDGISQGTPATRIVFEEGGVYSLNFTAQISSSSGQTISFRFWPRINGTDIAGSTILSKLHQNNASTVVSRAALFTMSAGDYLEVMWAVDRTNGFLKAEPATAYAPASPSTTLSVTRLRA